MKVHLDDSTCVGHGRCYAIAPEVFEADDRGHCVIRFDGDIPVELHDQARTGAANCPELALTIDE